VRASASSDGLRRAWLRVRGVMPSSVLAHNSRCAGAELAFRVQLQGAGRPGGTPLQNRCRCQHAVSLLSPF